MASEFEKSVQRVMEGLRVDPSGEVWQRVEERITENKRKRRIIFFIIFSLIGLTLAGYGIFNFSVRPNLKSEVGSLSTKGKPERMPKSPGAINTDQDKNIDNITPDTGTVKTQPPVGSVVSAETSGDKRSNKKVRGTNTGEISTQETNNSPSEILSAKKREAQVNTTQIANSKTISRNDQPIHPDSPHTVTNPVEPLILKDDINDSIAGRTSEPLTAAKKTGATHESKWKWGIDVSFGASTITQDPFSFKGTSYSDANAFSTPGTSTGSGQGSSTGSGVIYGPSSNKPAFAFKIGFHLKNGISPRSSLSAGLTYSYLADKIKIGQGQLNSQPSAASRSAYYTAAPQTSYTEHFHFIELPVIYDWRMSKNSNHYFSLGGGVSGSYLVSTNALLYDTAQHGIYYRDNSLFTRMHFNLMAGTAYHTATRKSEIAIGPQFFFDLSKLIDSDVDKRKYFLYVGLDTRIFFERAKSK